MHEALRLYKQAINLCPPDEKEDLAIFHNNMGICLNKLGLHLEAKGHFSTSIMLNPKYVKPLYHRMNIYKAEEEYDHALNDARKILEIDPNFLKPKMELQIIPELERL